MPPGATTVAPRSRAAAPPPPERPLPQLGRPAIAVVWAAAAAPMGLLAWVAAPHLADQLHGTARLARALIICLTAGLIWQFVLVLILVRREQGSLRWPVLRETLWLHVPRRQHGRKRGERAWLACVPALFAFGLMQLVPGLPHPMNRDLGKFLGSHAGHGFLAGSWGWFTVLATLFVFNTVLGESCCSAATCCHG